MEHVVLMLMRAMFVAAGPRLADAADDSNRTWFGWASGFTGVGIVLGLVLLATWLLRRHRR